VGSIRREEGKKRMGEWPSENKDVWDRLDGLTFQIVSWFCTVADVLWEQRWWCFWIAMILNIVMAFISGVLATKVLILSAALEDLAAVCR